MKDRLFIFLLVFLLYPEIGGGQPLQEKEEPKDFVSPSDLERATAEMKRAVRDAQRKSSAELAKERERQKQQNEEILRSGKESAEKLKKEMELTAKKHSEEVAAQRLAQSEADKKMLLVSAIVSSIILMSLIGLYLKIRTSKSSINVPINSLEQTTEEKIVLKNPTIPELLDFSRKNGDARKIMIKLSLSEKGTDLDGMEILCTTELRHDLPPLVYFEEEKNPVTWDQRKKRAAVIIARKRNGHIESIGRN